MADEIRFRRLSWQGHVARLPDDRLPVQFLFGQIHDLGFKGRPSESLSTLFAQGLIYSEGCVEVVQACSCLKQISLEMLGCYCTHVARA